MNLRCIRKFSDLQRLAGQSSRVVSPSYAGRADSSRQQNDDDAVLTI